MKRYIVVGIMMFFVLLVGCEKASQPERAASEEILIEPTENAKEPFEPFVVYKDVGTRDNHYIPSGFMPNGNCLTLNDRWQENCQEGKTCIKIVYDTECSGQDQGWAGVYWLNPANNWGTRKGGFNLQGAGLLTFWARGENGGERIEEFTIGGIGGEYPDSDTAFIGPVILSKDWQKYSIDLRGKDLSYISGGFAWTTNVKVNLKGCTFYLDNIQYE